MNHKVTLRDVSADLRRCVYLSLTEKEFNTKSFEVFFSHAEKGLKEVKKELDPELLKVIESELSKVKDKKLTIERRRENLLNASILLQLNSLQ